MKTWLGSQDAWKVIEESYKATRWNHCILNQKDFFYKTKNMIKKDNKLLSSSIKQWMKILFKIFQVQLLSRKPRRYFKTYIKELINKKNSSPNS